MAALEEVLAPVYVAGLFAELHGGELRETPDGVVFTVPLAG